MNSQQVTAVGGFAYGVVGADIHVFGDGTPLYVLENWRPPAEPDAAWLAEQPSRMLNARFEVVGFTGREAELESLHRWCTEGPLRATRWLHAPGGQGKTRLANRLAREAGAAGWKVVTATEGSGSVLPPSGSQDLRLTDSAGVLLLVDYADQWAMTTLTWLFSNALLHRPDMPTRVLLLARSAAPWPALRAALVNTQVSTSAQQLPPLDASSGPDAQDGRHDGRSEMFDAAGAGFAARYGVAPPRERPDLTHPDFGLTLAVHMAALVAVDARAAGRRAPADLAGLTVYLLDREQLGWVRRYEKRGEGRISTPSAVMNRAVFAASLGGPQPTGRGTALVESLTVGRPAATVVADHAVCYPPQDPAGGTVLEPLCPDRLAEDFVALTLPGHPADYPAQTWAPDAAATVLRRAAGPGRPVAALTAAAGRWAHVGRQCLYPLLAADPGLAVTAGGAALTALAGLADIGPGLLEDVVAHVPDPVPADLTVGRAAVLVRLFAHRLAGTDDPAAQARLFVDHGNDLRDLGRHEEARQAAERSVELFTALAEDDPRQYEEHLGRALTNLSDHRNRCGQREEALRTQRQVLGIFERLAAVAPQEYEPHLAMALANLALRLERNYHWEEAYRANQDAVRLYRTLAARDPRYREGLTIALTNGGGLTFRPDGGTDLLREAVALRRELADEDPVGHGPLLATSLLALRSELSAAGAHAEAVRAAEQAVGINRRLAGANPLGYEVAFATALGMLRSSLLDAGRPADAVAAGEEAVAVWRRLAGAAPATHGRSLATALREQNTALNAAGLPADPEADAHRRVVHLKERARPAVTVRVSGWRAAPLPPRPPRDWQFDATARRLARARDWPAYWELVCSVPIADAVRLARRIPRRRWSPPADGDRELLAQLCAAPARRSAVLAAASAPAATTELPEDLALFDGSIASVAHGRGILAEVVHDFGDSRKATRTIETLDLAAGHRSVLWRGDEYDHSSLACLGADDVVAVRAGRASVRDREIVRYGSNGATVLGRSAHFTGARAVPTADGCVIGLGLAPAALVLAGRGGLRQVDVLDWGLSRTGLVAVHPDGERMVLCDGHRLVATDTALTGAMAVGQVPAGHGGVRDLVFADRDLLLTADRPGGVTLWEVSRTRLTPVARHDTPLLHGLFAVPEWGVAGGRAGSRAGTHFFATTGPGAGGGGTEGVGAGGGLAPVALPPAMIVHTEFLKRVLAPPGGRFVAYSGQLDARAPAPRRSFRQVTRVHDLHHPGALLQRPTADLTAEETVALVEAARAGRTTDGAAGADPLLRDLLVLAGRAAVRLPRTRAALW